MDFCLTKIDFAIISSYRDISLLPLDDCDSIITFKESISFALNKMGIEHQYMPLYTYSRTGSFIYDILKLFIFFRGKSILVFSNHDCIPTALAVRFCKVLFFYDNYPYVERNTKLKITNFKHITLNFVLALKISYFCENGLQILCFKELIDKKAQQKVILKKDIHKINSFEKRIIYVGDDTFSRNIEYVDTIKSYLFKLNKKYPDHNIYVKLHPKNLANVNNIYFNYPSLDTNYPIEKIINDSDILVGIYSSIFEDKICNKVYSLVDVIIPTTKQHADLLNCMKVRMQRIGYEKLR